MHLAPLIRDLAVILGTAGIVTLIFQRIRQPVVLGYLVAGMIIGPHTPPMPLVTDIPNIQIWAELGVIFLMFSLGLEFSFRKLARVGVSASFTATLEVVLMLSLGFGCGKLLGWSTIDSLFVGAMLSISSTTIILKALDEFGLKTRRFAELVLGVLIVEDLFAILILVGLSTFTGTDAFEPMLVVRSGVKLALAVGSWFAVGYFLLPRFMKYAGRVGSDEMVTILSMGLCLTLVAVAAALHYSVALGAFIMGSILSESTEVHRIEKLIKPIRDVFAAVFFVSVGMLIDPSSIGTHFKAILFISVVTILGKILSTGLGALATGQTLKTSTQVGFSLAQIGEFSFIIAGLGVTMKVTSDFIYPVGVAVSLITTFLTPYLIQLAEPFASRLEARLPPRTREFLAQYVALLNKPRSTNKRWVEFQRLLTKIFQLRAEETDSAEVLAPWDAHLVKLRVHPNAPFVRKNLIEIGLRNRIGINIVAIHRGDETIVAPDPSETLNAHDELLVLGTDDQIEKARGWIEIRNKDLPIGKPLSSYQLKNILVTDESSLKERSIREAGIREKYRAIVVGVERGGKRSINPNSDYVIRSGDILWLVGDPATLP